MNKYMQVIRDAGFENVKIQKEKTIKLPDDLLDQYLDEGKKELWKASQVGIFSITVYGEKPASQSKDCCGPSCCD